MRARVPLFVLGICVPGLASAQVPAGGEFQVNTYTTSHQYAPAASADASGRTVVTWLNNRSLLDYRVDAQLFDAVGARIGSEFQALGPLFNASPAHVASAFGGDFVITVSWGISHPVPTAKVLGQSFASDGTPLGQPFTVPSNISFDPRAAWVPGGGFVVVWSQKATMYSDADARGQRFDARGVRVGSEFGVNTYTTGNQIHPAIAVNAQGGFLVAWNSADQDGSGPGVYAQRFSADGTHLGAEFQVNVVTTSEQSMPRVAAAAAGGFVIVWQSSGQDGAGRGVFGRRFSEIGTPLGTEFLVNSSTTFDESNPDVAADVAGNFVVTWTSAGSDIRGQRFNSLAERRGAEFRVNTTAGSGSSVAVDPYGNFSIVWSGPDGSGNGVFAQRFGGLYGAALDVDTAGNRVLEPGEAVNFRTSWYNVNGAAQTFGGLLTAIAGPPGAAYTIDDGSASYGTVANATIAQCVDCYGVAVSNPPSRPSTHWDAFALESIVPDAHGQQKPWTLHVGGSFSDVPAASPFYRFVETMLHRGITSGCSGTTYCPASSTTREQMAVFVLLARRGAGYRPPDCTTPVFADVPASSPFCPFIEELVRRGVASGCGGGNYCPADPVSREQMAVFVLRTLDPALDPPACGTPVFADVPASSPFCRWIEELARRGVVSGCGGGYYCPAAPVSREQMSVFLGVTFGLTLYGGA